VSDCDGRFIARFTRQQAEVNRKKEPVVAAERPSVGRSGGARKPMTNDEPSDAGRPATADAENPVPQNVERAAPNTTADPPLEVPL
jgi:hypothetical protein